jgi:hypothetical protein
LKTRFESQFWRMKSQRFSTGLSSGDFGGSGRIVMFRGHDQVIEHVPPRLIHDEDGMSIVCDMTGDFSQMLGHGIGIAPWHDQRCRLAELRADRAEDVG